MSEGTGTGHAELLRCLQGLSLPIGPAEAQALLYGLLCGKSEASRELWLGELLPEALDMDNLLHRECGKSLAILYDRTRSTFEDSGFDIDLMLPEENTPLRERAGELIDWCRGFLYGLGLTGNSMEQLGEEAREGLTDLGEITKLDLDSLEEGEQQEVDLSEIVEFIRVAVLLIREDLAPLQQEQPRQ